MTNRREGQRVSLVILRDLAGRESMFLNKMDGECLQRAQGNHADDVALGELGLRVIASRRSEAPRFTLPQDGRHNRH